MSEVVKRKKALFLNDTSVEKHFGCLNVVNNLTKILYESGIDVVCYVPQYNLDSIDSILRKCDADVSIMIINGEGTLHGDRPIVFKLLKCIDIGVERGLSVIILNATVENNSAYVYGALNRSKLIFFRETKSYFNMLESVNRKGLVFCDAVFLDLDFITFEFDSKRNKLNDVVYVDDSVLPSVSVDLNKVRKKFNAQSLTIFYSSNRFLFALDFFKRIPRGLILDPLLLLKYVSLLPGQLCSMQSDFESFKNKVSSAKFVVTGRFHMVCFLVAMEIPFYAVESNTSKISSFLSDIGLSSRVFKSVEDLLLFSQSRGFVEYNEEEICSIRKFKGKVFIYRSSIIDELKKL